MCVCVCVSERERERERICVCERVSVYFVHEVFILKILTYIIYHIYSYNLHYV